MCVCVKFPLLLLLVLLSHLNIMFSFSSHVLDDDSIRRLSVEHDRRSHSICHLMLNDLIVNVNFLKFIMKS